MLTRKSSKLMFTLAYIVLFVKLFIMWLDGLGILPTI